MLDMSPGSLLSINRDINEKKQTTRTLTIKWTTLLETNKKKFDSFLLI